MDTKNADKKALLELLIAQVTDDLYRARQAALAAAEGATHEENRAEGSKDMRATEASYLARGQVMRVEELEASLNRLRLMPLASFNAETPISAGALVCLEDEDATVKWYWLVTAAAGYRLKLRDISLTTITVQSPLGRELVERRQGDGVELFAGGRHQQLDIIEVK